MSRKCQDLHIIKHKKIIPTYFLLKVLLIYELDLRQTRIMQKKKWLLSLDSHEVPLRKLYSDPEGKDRLSQHPFIHMGRGRQHVYRSRLNVALPLGH